MADVAVPVPGLRHAPLDSLDFTVVDVETTGWQPDEAGITEIGAVRVRGGRVVAEFSSLVNPGTPVPPAITELTGISDQMLASAPPVAAVLPGLLAFAEGSVLAAHNAPFDLRFLTAACAGMGREWPSFEVLDTVRLARHLMATPQEVPDRKLATLARFFGTPVEPSHRALDDARATADVLRRLLTRLRERAAITTLDDLDVWLDTRDAELRRAEAQQRAAALSGLRGLVARIRRTLRRLAVKSRAGKSRAAKRSAGKSRAGTRHAGTGQAPGGGHGADRR